MKRIICIIAAGIMVISLGGCGKHEHSWIEADCITPKTCSECGQTEGEALGHNWKAADCNTPKTCVVRGQTEGDPLGHSWIDANCTSPKKCTRCGYTEGEPLGHDAPGLSCTQDGICARCGEHIDALGHDWKDANCTEPKICNRCGETEGKALGHTPDDPKRENEKAATCTEEGKYDEVVYCSVCKTELSRTGKTEHALGHTTSSGKCSRCGAEVYETISGSGDDVVSNITLGDGMYRVHFTNTGNRNFIVWAYDSTNNRDLLVNTIGAYDGYVYLAGSAPFSFEIQSSGKWSYTIERLVKENETSFSGHGDYVTNIFSATSGTWEFTHSGKRNFVVWLYTTNGRDLLVNEIGSYSGKKIVSIPSGSNAFFEITADGNWSLKPVK